MPERKSSPDDLFGYQGRRDWEEGPVIVRWPTWALEILSADRIFLSLFTLAVHTS